MIQAIIEMNTNHSKIVFHQISGRTMLLGLSVHLILVWAARGNQRKDAKLRIVMSPGSNNFFDSLFRLSKMIAAENNIIVISPP